MAPFLGAADIWSVGGSTLVPWVATALRRFFCCRPAFFSTRSRASLLARERVLAVAALLGPLAVHDEDAVGVAGAVVPVAALPLVRLLVEDHLLRLRFLMPFSLANFSHLVMGFS